MSASGRVPAPWLVARAGVPELDQAHRRQRGDARQAHAAAPQGLPPILFRLGRLEVVGNQVPCFSLPRCPTEASGRAVVMTRNASVEAATNGTSQTMQDLTNVFASSPMSPRSAYFGVAGPSCPRAAMSGRGGRRAGRGAGSAARHHGAAPSEHHRRPRSRSPARDSRPGQARPSRPGARVAQQRVQHVEREADRGHGVQHPVFGRHFRAIA